MGRSSYIPFVLALTTSASDLYAGGYFTTAGGSPAYDVAKWDGSHWTALGEGINGTVRALVMSGSDCVKSSRTRWVSRCPRSSH